MKHTVKAILLNPLPFNLSLLSFSKILLVFRYFRQKGASNLFNAFNSYYKECEMGWGLKLKYAMVKVTKSVIMKSVRFFFIFFNHL